jgi:hypothetical protein
MLARRIANECRDLGDFGSRIRIFFCAGQGAARSTNTSVWTVAMLRDRFDRWV